MTIVVMQSGKSISTADYIELRVFEDKEQAEGFCEVNTDLSKKYWTYCEIIEPNEKIELFYNDGSEF